ncbi:MAG: MBOAT family protein [Clostridiales bacterium]|nr:MBOAT family protein [Clostridiales bacterium]
MVFSGIPFLYYFLPAALLLYFAVPKQLKNGALLAASLVFYAWGEPKYVFLMMGTVILGYLFGILIEKHKGTGKAKLWLALSVICSAAILCCFKYADFFIENFNAATGMSLPFLRIALPVGISFYTFQLLSYLIDVYRGDAAAQKNFINLAAYISMFPQLVAGPIVRYTDVKDKLENRAHTFEDIAWGIRKFVIGLSKKVLIANNLAQLCDVFRASAEPSVMFYWIYAVTFTLYIYFDFSGYSDMAIGLGRILGFKFMENFNYPYISKSITEFWRRWHISLGSWFRDYVYIPLGGNRRSKPRWFLNIFIVWMLTGFWHGAAWNFIVWGLYFAVILVAEKLFLSKALDRIGPFSHIYAVLLVMIGFVVFNAADMGQAVSDISYMFGKGDLPVVTEETMYYLKSYFIILAAAAIGATPLPKKMIYAAERTALGQKFVDIAEPVFLVILVLLATAYLVDGSFNPFLYFRF